MSHIKGKVYKPPLPETIQELKHTIAFAVALVTQEKLKEIKDNMTHRLNETIEIKGRHFENMKIKIDYETLFKLNK